MIVSALLTEETIDLKISAESWSILCTNLIHLIPRKILEHIIKESKYPEDNKVIKSSQLGFIRSKYCLKKTHFLLWQDERLSRWGKEIDMIFLNFSKSFNTASHENVSKIRKYSLDKTTVRWAHNHFEWSYTKGSHQWLNV